MNASSRKSQSGSALIISLILLVLLTIIGVSGIQNTTMQETMSGNTKEQHRSFHAAELGLRRAEEAATGFVSCGSNFISSVLNANKSEFTTLTLPDIDGESSEEVEVRFYSDFCGPITREISFTGNAASSDLGGQSKIMIQYYTVVSVGEVPGNATTQLVSTVAKQ